MSSKELQKAIAEGQEDAAREMLAEGMGLPEELDEAQYDYTKMKGAAQKHLKARASNSATMAAATIFYPDVRKDQKKIYAVSKALRSAFDKAIADVYEKIVKPDIEQRMSKRLGES